MVAAYGGCGLRWSLPMVVAAYGGRCTLTDEKDEIRYALRLADPYGHPTGTVP